MTARTLVLLLLIGMLSTSLWAQGNSCRQYNTWFVSANAGSGSQPVYFGNDLATQIMEQYQAQYEGAGPVCSAVWVQAASPSAWSGGCHSVVWTCAPPPPPVGGCATCNKAGEPIDLGSGNVYIRQTDVQLPGVGGGLTLTRTWSSVSPGGGLAMFGPGWVSNYQEWVFPGSDGTMKYMRSDGSVWSFAYYGDPAAFHLIAPANLQASLTEQGPDSSGAASWTVTFQNGETRIFAVNPAFLDKNNHYQNNGGPLSSISDRNGNTTLLNYQTDINGVDTRLLSVTDPAGRHLYFNYGTGGSLYVTSVTSDPGSGINLTYTYAPSLSSATVLAQVTHADNTFVTFTYDAFLNITSVNDTNGKVLESHTYDSNRRGLSSSRANGVEALTVAYPTSP